MLKIELKGILRFENSESTFVYGDDEHSPGYEAIKSFFSEEHWKRDKVTSKQLPPTVRIGAATSAFEIEGKLNIVITVTLKINHCIIANSLS